MSGGAVPRIGVNLAWLVPGVVGGSEEATISALAAVAESDAFELVLFALPSLAVAHPELVARFETHEVGGSPNQVLRILAENTSLRRAVRRHRIDLVHHAGGVVPPGVGVASVLAIHDTQPLDLPQNFSIAKRRYLGVMIGRSVRAARQITVPSEFVKRRVQAHTAVDPDRISVVPWTVPRAAPVSDDERSTVLERYGLARPFVVYPAIAYAHKNHRVLVEAMGRWADQGWQVGEHDLVLSGAPGPLDDEVRRWAVAAGVSERVHQLGRVPRRHLEVLMDAAAVVAVPSRYEGFGLPAAEAVTAGRPLVVADAGSLPEVAGSRADGPRSHVQIVGVDDVEGWTAALVAAVGAPPVGASESGGPSWSPTRTAAALSAAWQRALDGPPP